jgi:ATP-dependent 26S proteasome regulatory subunit
MEGAAVPVTASFPHDAPAPTIRSRLHPLGHNKIRRRNEQHQHLAQATQQETSCNGVYIQTIFVDAGVTKVRRKRKTRLRPRLENGYEWVIRNLCEQAGIILLKFWAELSE